MSEAPEIAVAYVSIVPEIQGFARQLREQIVGPAGDAGADAGEAAGSGLKDKLKLGAAAAALAAGAVIAKGLGDAIEQANITSKLQAQLGATGPDAAKYGKIAGKLYSKGITENFEQGAEAVRAVVNGGLVKPDATNKQLQSIAAKMSDVATTFGTDMGMQTQAVSALMKNGLAKNAGDALDVITVGMQKLGPNAEDLLETFQEYPRQLQKLGLDAKMSMGLFQQGLQGGARDTDIIADSLKEFSIRSIDMSKTSRDAYKALGLNAEQMEAQIAKGGKGAQAGLQTVLDKLRGMKDPVERNAAAVGLFGTQAEDLGDALFKLDPSKAVAAVGDVGGAAAKMGKTLHSGPSHELEVFQRRIQQGLTDVMAKYAVPALTNLAHAANTYLVPAIKTAKDVTVGLFEFVADNAWWISSLTTMIAGLTLAVKAQAIWTGVLNGVTKITTAVTRGWAIAQGILNTVMAMNPFVLVAIAIAALVVGLVVAYNRSETFRTIVQAAFKAVGDAGIWLWEKAIKPSFDFIAGITVWLWDKIIKPYFTFILNYWKAVGGIAKSLWTDFISPAFSNIAAGAKWLWSKGVKEPFQNLMDGVGKISAAFTSAKDTIGKQWSKLSGIAKTPISFIIDTVYNSGIVGTWNKIATAFGAPKLAEFHPKGFAKGGTYEGVRPGYTPGRDNALIAVGGGESIMRPEWTRAMGSGYVNGMNSLARKGGVGAVKKAIGGGMPAFKDGGIFNWVGNKLQGAGSAAWDKIKDGASWLKDGMEASARAGLNKVVKPLIDRIPGSSTLYGQAVKGIPNKMIDSLFGYAKGADKKISESGIGGKGTASALRFARAQAGKPYIWGGVGPEGFDCSGLMGALENLIMGRAANRRIWATGAFSGDTAPSGWVRGMKAPFTIGITNAGVGHTAGTLNGVNVESRGGSGVLVGNRARGYKDSLFTDFYGFSPSKKFDNGGWLMPGARMTANETGKPEPVFTGSQWSILSTLANRGALGSAGGLKSGDRLILTTSGGAEFEAYVDSRADSRINAGLTGPALLGRTL
ncbi:phage tail tape measure protein [Streptomyces sp. NPDC054950]